MIWETSVTLIFSLSSRRRAHVYSLGVLFLHCLFDDASDDFSIYISF